MKTTSKEFAQEILDVLGLSTWHIDGPSAKILIEMIEKRDKNVEKEASKPNYAIDHLGKPMSGDDVCRTLAAMLGWSNVPKWPVLEQNIRENNRRLKQL